MPTNIEWCQETWNPVTGCTSVSEGCTNCYARRMAETRLRGRCGYPEKDPFRPGLRHPKQWDKPLHWKSPRMIFVCSMGDLFHEAVPLDVIRYVLHTTILCPQHTFLILTKRPERMAEGVDKFIAKWKACYRVDLLEYEFPLPNLWLGVTAENQARADERIPILLQIPAAVRFVSVEPMLGPVDLTAIDTGKTWPGKSETAKLNALRGYTSSKRAKSGILGDPTTGGASRFIDSVNFSRIDWVICGGETGPGARQMDAQWARDLRDQCQDAGVPFFMKKMSGGGAPPADLMIRELP